MVDQPDEENCCLPGDLTVTQVPYGYLIGQAIDKPDYGPWWNYIAVVPTLNEALGYARRLAREQGVRAWLHKGADRYERIPLE